MISENPSVRSVSHVTVLTCAALMAFVAGCDFLGLGAGTTQKPDAGNLTPKETAEALQSVRANLEKLRRDTTIKTGERNLGKELRSVAQAVREVSMVDTVIVPDDRLTVTAVLKNGVTLLLSNNRPEVKDPTRTDTASASETGHLPVGSNRKASGKAASGIRRSPGASSPTFPDSKKAIVVAHDGGAAQAQKVRTQLAQAGYNVTSIGASRSDMRNNYKNIGVLYLDTHGGTFNILRGQPGRIGIDSARGPRFALQTSTKANLTPAWIKANEQELLNNEIVLSSWCVLGKNCAEDIDSVSTSGTGVKVAVTDKFISKHWDFARGGMAYIHACRAGGDRPGAKAIRRAILQDAGAEALVSTEGDTNASILGKSIVSTFKMLLGTDREAFGRPWPLGKVKAALSKMNLLKFEWTTGQFDIEWSFPGDLDPREDVTTKVRFFGGQSARLAPSIRRLEVIDDASKSTGRLQIKGSFPQSKGRVTIGAKQLRVRSWSQDKVVAAIPFDGKTSTGAVGIKHPEGYRGNAVNLTKWTGSMEAVVQGKGTQVARSDLKMIFRGDVHPIRKTPTSDPKLPDTMEAYVSPASGGTIEGSGSYQDVSWTGTSDYKIATKKQVDKWYGIGPVQYSKGRASGGTSLGSQPTGTDDPYGPPNTFGGKIVLRPREGKGHMCLRINGQVKAESPQASGKVTLPAAIYLASLNNSVDPTGSTVPLGCVDVSFRDLPTNPAIRSGQVSAQSPSQSDLLSTTFTWRRLTVQNPPLSRSQ